MISTADYTKYYTYFFEYFGECSLIQYIQIVKLYLVPYDSLCSSYSTCNKKIVISVTLYQVFIKLQTTFQNKAVCVYPRTYQFEFDTGLVDEYGISNF